MTALLRECPSDHVVARHSAQSLSRADDSCQALLCWSGENLPNAASGVGCRLPDVARKIGRIFDDHFERVLMWYVGTAGLPKLKAE